MIEEIRILDLGAIDDAVLTPGTGLTVITGETGAGKTMLLTALDLLLGGRADPGLIRPGAARCAVEGRFSLPAASPALVRATEAGADLDDDGSLLVARTIAGGRSRAHLGGRAVPQGVLGEIGAQLVAVHGQSDQVRLRAPSQQRHALDTFAGPDHHETVAALRRAHALWQAATAALDERRGHERVRELEIASLTDALAQIASVAPEPGEDDALRLEASRLDHIEELRSAVAFALESLDGRDQEPGVVGALETSARELGRAAAHEPLLADWAQRLAESVYLLTDLAGEIGHLFAGLEADPRRLGEVHERRAVLTALGRTYGVRWHGPGDEPESTGSDSDSDPGSVAAVLRWAEHARHRLTELTSPDQGIDAWEARVAALAAERDALAARVSAGRRHAAAALGEAVTAELAGLAMTGARLGVDLRDIPVGAHGAEEVTLVLEAHPGAPAVPLGQGASGGELSRVMLALEVVLAARRGDEAPPTLVFDEVDAGVGGRAAVEVGRRLARLARTSQVIVVTHLAQVAAFADVHVVVIKELGEAEASGTRTTVRALQDAEREGELARMLSGEVTETSVRHAADLIARAVVGS